MRTLYGVVLVALMLIAGVASAQERLRGDDKVRETQTTYIVHYRDGKTERVVVKYEALLGYLTWQTGGVARPLNLKIIDDRQCHFSSDARVYRRAYVITHAGVQAPIEEYQAIYKASHEMSRGPDNFFEAVTRHVTCGEVNLFRDRVENAKADLVSQFDSLVSKDDDKARERLRKMLQGDRIEVKKS